MDPIVAAIQEADHARHEGAGYHLIVFVEGLNPMRCSKVDLITPGHVAKLSMHGSPDMIFVRRADIKAVQIEW
jgi:hypothetical protein